LPNSPSGNNCPDSTNRKEHTERDGIGSLEASQQQQNHGIDCRKREPDCKPGYNTGEAKIESNYSCHLHISSAYGTGLYESCYKQESETETGT